MSTDCSINPESGDSHPRSLSDPPRDDWIAQSSGQRATITYHPLTHSTHRQGLSDVRMHMSYIREMRRNLAVTLPPQGLGDGGTAIVSQLHRSYFMCSLYLQHLGDGHAAAVRRGVLTVRKLHQVHPVLGDRFQRPLSRHPPNKRLAVT